MTSTARGDLFIVSSPSGGGKTTLIRRLLADPPGEPLHFAVSHTTRPMRAGETEGREYHFTSVSEFQRMVERDEFLEHNNVHDNIYGTSKAEVLPHLAAGEDVVLDIDVQGARDVRRAYPDAIMIFIAPSSQPELQRRLRLRGLDGEEIIRKRLINAAREIREALDYQYLIVNDDLDRATLELQSIVRARRLTPARQAARLERIRKEFR
ncbi:MAG TPA: guanylate kinase [Thermoanaerobaculia bacterium]|jgi:guanylate kinase|nr:guanylate kinase [Thermoanaerobaculia bacterium]